MNCLIAYVTYSGNTEEIAELIEQHLQKENMDVTLFEIGVDNGTIPFHLYDIIFLGTFTWDYGDIPDELIPFLHQLKDKQGEFAIFGSGDMQFGGEKLFCHAVDQLIDFFNSKWSGLKIEQSPRGVQEKLVKTWTERVLLDVKENNSCKNVRTAFS